MDWAAALQAGFRDELKKISEVNLSGLDAGTLLNYPRPQPMPSAAYEKAQSILQKMQPLPVEKTKISGSFSPDPGAAPMSSRLFGRRKKEEKPGKVDKAKSVGGHALAGAGTAKFMGDFVESSLAAKKKLPKFMLKKHYQGRFPPAVKASIMAGGAGLGLAELARKAHHRRKAQRGQR